MDHRDKHEGLKSLAWVEEFGIGWPELGACTCSDCTGEPGDDLGPSRASIVSATFALDR